MELFDDLGHEVVLAGPPSRVVSLVPSLTEAIEVTAPGLVVAATDWCVYPPDLDVQRVRGTKNPDCRAIAALAPDLVVANMEENREIDVRRLRDAGVPVWVTRIETVDAGVHVDVAAVRRGARGRRADVADRGARGVGRARGAARDPGGGTGVARPVVRGRELDVRG